MHSKEIGRIGIFEYEWSMYGFTREFIVKLADAGYFIDIFQKDPDFNRDFAYAEQFTKYNNIRYFNLKTPNTLRRKIGRRLKKLFALCSCNNSLNARRFIDSEILQRSTALVTKSNYLCFIGIEKKGLLWAGILSQMFKCPLIYYSLELYIEDHPRLAAELATKEFSDLRRLEKRYHQLCVATIIQHETRAKALQQFNEIGPAKWFYLPISARGSIVKEKSAYFLHKYNISEGKKLLLYFGVIQDERYSTALVKIAGNLMDDVILALHGFGNITYLDYLQSITSADRVIFSFDMVGEEHIVDVISSATIGLALYENTNSNDRLAAFSSAKVAYYMQCGVPVIAFRSESFIELMNAHKCGELIDSIEEIPEKVERILLNYSCYRDQAFMAFKQFYDFDKNFGMFIVAFSDFMKREVKTTLEA
jgi:glycosyltransferase involved in cell wall biosynthesis